MTITGILAAVIPLLGGWIIHRQNRYIAYLEALAAGRNLWNVRCSACMRRLRDAAVTSYADAGPRPGAEITSHFHSAPRPCAGIGRNRLNRRETPNA